MSGAPDVIDAPADQRDTGLVVQAMTRGELEMQVELAKKYPRDIRRFRDEATALATLDEATAAQCFYALPGRRKPGGGVGAPIEGPSARFAEIAVSAWGNCQAGARVMAEEDKFVTAQGVFRDLERNTCITREVRRRITTKEGRRYSDDMISVTANAACSIALRNAVFNGIPKAFWQPIYTKARLAAIGDTQTMSAKREALVGYFAKMGVGEDRVLATIGVESLDAVGVEHLTLLKGIATAIKEGEISVDAAFPPIGDGDVNTKSTAESLLDRLKRDKAKRPLAEPASPAEAVEAGQSAPPTDAEQPVWEEPQVTDNSEAPAVAPPQEPEQPEPDGESGAIADVDFDTIGGLDEGIKFSTRAMVKKVTPKRANGKDLVEVELYDGPHIHRFTQFGSAPDWLVNGIVVDVLEAFRTGPFNDKPQFTVRRWQAA